MAENNSTDGLPCYPRSKQFFAGLLRLCWPLPGALTGAALGFHLYFRQPGLNTDSVAPLIFASAWALGGIFCGVLITSVAVWLIHRSMQHLLTTRPVITAAVTLAGLIALCLVLYAPLETRLPDLLWPKHPTGSLRPPPPGTSPCTLPPPSEAGARKSWELECR